MLRQGFILGFGSTAAEEMANAVSKLRAVSSIAYRGT